MTTVDTIHRLTRYLIALGTMCSSKAVYVVTADSATHAVQRLGDYLEHCAGCGHTQNIRLVSTGIGTWNLNADIAHPDDQGHIKGSIMVANQVLITDGRYGEFDDEVLDIDADAYLDDLPDHDWTNPALIPQPLTA